MRFSSCLVLSRNSCLIFAFLFTGLFSFSCNTSVAYIFFFFPKKSVNVSLVWAARTKADGKILTLLLLLKLSLPGFSVAPWISTHSHFVGAPLWRSKWIDTSENNHNFEAHFFINGDLPYTVNNNVLLIVEGYFLQRAWLKFRIFWFCWKPL